MVNYFIPPLLGTIFITAFLLKGCAPAATDRSEGSSFPFVETGATSGATTGTTTVASKSSLEAMRRGEIPAEGPLKSVYFDFDRYDLRTEARETLNANVGWLKANPGARVEIEGHADERGTNEYNLALGAKRAQSSKEYLVSLGISEERISTISYGEEVLVCKDRTEQCWQKNRRARFVVIAAGPAL